MVLQALAQASGQDFICPLHFVQIGADSVLHKAQWRPRVTGRCQSDII